MKVRSIGLLSIVGLAMAFSGTSAVGQGDTPEAHIAAAKAAAGSEYAAMFNTLCVQALGRIGAPPAAPAAPAAAGQPSGPPDRSAWHAEPVKVFDNVIWLGTKGHSAWAILTSDGIILMDAIFDYAVRDEVVEGLKKLGLNPASIKYAIMGHWHGDHAGGAKTLQELYGTKIIMGPADWDSMEKSTAAYKPKKDTVATDGMKVTLGDTTVTVYVTPAHTPGTLSSIFQVKDGGRTHTVAYWGGTLYNWIGRTTTGTGEYVGKTEKFWFTQYADTAARFRGIAAKAGADVYMSNHTAFDGSMEALPKMATRKPGDPHPLVVGKDAVQRYLTMAGECARAGALRTKS